MFNKLANFRKDKKGFTLVEIIVVLVILAILAAIGIPTMMGFINQANDQALIANARTAYMAAQTEASKAAGAAIAAGATTVTYLDTTATPAETWMAKVNPMLDTPATTLEVVLANESGVKAGTVSRVLYSSGGRVAVINVAYAGAPTSWQSGTEVFDAADAPTLTSTISQTISGTDVN